MKVQTEGGRLMEKNVDYQYTSTHSIQQVISFFVAYGAPCWCSRYTCTAVVATVCFRPLVKAILKLVSWCFKQSQRQRIISGLKETFIKRYVVERTNKAEIRPEEQSEKAESCRENL